MRIFEENELLPGRENNFDLIRLLAAIQVVILHAMTHFDMGESIWRSIAMFFPGVPVFFFVSGFLISQSYERSDTLGGYLRKRALRIFPALWVVTVISLIAIWASGYFHEVSVDVGDLAIWVLGQTTIVQFYNPEIFRNFGVGVVNGALWTITVELQFYLIMPLLSVLLLRSRLGYLVLLVLQMVGAFLFLQYFLPRNEELFLSKLTYVTFLPWIGMFMLGHLSARNWVTIRPFVERRFGSWLTGYAVLALGAVFIEDALGVQISGNRIIILMFLPLAGLVLSAAYSGPALARKILRENDVSYGLYLYHMPVINFWIYCGMQQGVFGVVSCLLVAIAFAIVSWVVVEKPALRLKTSK